MTIAPGGISVETPNGYDNIRSEINLTVSRLSKLQRWMLVRAEENHCGPEPLFADLFSVEVLVDFYHFELKCPKNPGFHGGYRLWLTWGNRFRREIIGHTRYNAAYAAVSRAARRLVDRGLMEYRCCGRFNLTDEGRTAARAAG